MSNRTLFLKKETSRIAGNNECDYPKGVFLFYPRCTAQYAAVYTTRHSPVHRIAHFSTESLQCVGLTIRIEILSIGYTIQSNFDYEGTPYPKNQEAMLAF